jgi:hypothetical protein
MAKMKSSGSISSDYVPLSELREVESSDKMPVHPSPQDRLKSENYVKNTVDSANAVPDNSNLISAINAFIAGIPIQVTFYHAINNDTYGRSFSTDFDRELDPVHTSYLKIHNFQMMLKEGMRFEYDQEMTRSQQTGEAVLYPYFCPNQGDLFLYELPNNVTGLFKIIDTPNRLAIHDTTCHEIRFKLVDYLTPRLREQIEMSVSEEAWFNLQRYLADKGALLTSEETNLLKQATDMFSMLAHVYGEEFYNHDTYNTFIEDVKLYDPYVVEFVTRVVESSRLPGYPTQLMPDPGCWKRSFWFKLLDPKMVPDPVIVNKANKTLHRVNYRTARINALANRHYIELHPNGEYSYPPFKIPECYSDDIISVPMQASLYFKFGQVRPSVLLRLGNEVLSMRRVARFYYIPIILFLLKKLILALTNGGDSMIKHDPITDSCTLDDCDNCDYISDKLPNIPKCTLPEGFDEYICPFIPPCGGSITDDDEVMCEKVHQSYDDIYHL